MASHGYAVFNRDPVDGDEGNHIGRSHAGMRASMHIEVDEFSGLAHATNGGFLDGSRSPARVMTQRLWSESISRSSR